MSGFGSRFRHRTFCVHSPQGTRTLAKGWFREGQAAILMEDLTMFIRKGAFSSAGRAAVLATVAAVALTAVAPSMALAGSAPHGKGTAATSTVTDISARRRHGGGGAAAAAAFAGIVGTGLAIAAAQNRRDYYDGYYDAPAYYAPRPYYGQPYYGGYRTGYPNAGW